MLPRRWKRARKALLNDHIARRNSAPGTTDHVVWDTVLAGFGLHVRASSNNSWIVHYRQRGKLKKVTLGLCVDVDATDARAKARRCWQRQRSTDCPSRRGQNPSRYSKIMLASSMPTASSSGNPPPGHRTVAKLSGSSFPTSAICPSTKSARAMSSAGAIASQRGRVFSIAPSRYCRRCCNTPPGLAIAKPGRTFRGEHRATSVKSWNAICRGWNIAVSQPR